MNSLLFHNIVAELIDENPFACRALLKIVAIEFSDRIPTLAVTTGGEPKLLVNLGFVGDNCKTEAHVKALICHEFLHVLLRHTDRIQLVTEADNLAFDAVINAIIHRELGAGYSGFMQGYYAQATGMQRLLRPWLKGEVEYDGRYDTPSWYQDEFDRLWVALYSGKIVADDLRELANDLQAPLRCAGGWLGNHGDIDADAGCAAADDISPVVAEALNRSLKSMNGDGIWRLPKERGVGADAYRNQVDASTERVERWRRSTWQVLRKHLLPDPQAPRTVDELTGYRLPVLSPGDRRSFARALWSPLLPEAAWASSRRISGGSAQVYLDVSGSMSAEMPLIVALLARLGRHIRRPFWAFSDVVAPAVIRDGRLHADTTGGTSISCVLQHVATTRPESAVIVTDGYIGPVNTRLLRDTAPARLHAVVTRDGSPHALRVAGIPYTQLGKLPQ